MKKSKIGWTDYSGSEANFVIGCTPVSEGCKNCYAKALATRYGWDWGDFRSVRTYSHKLKSLSRWKPTRGSYKRGEDTRPMCFVVDLGDLFHENVPKPFIYQALDILGENKAVDWQILTKRPQRALNVIRDWGGVLPEHIWIGATAENQARLDERWPVLRSIQAKVRFLSLEPLLEPVTISSFDGLGWVILGAESGALRRPFDVAWARTVRDACQRADVPFFYKQGSGRYPGNDPYLDGKLIQQYVRSL